MFSGFFRIHHLCRRQHQLLTYLPLIDSCSVSPVLSACHMGVCIDYDLSFA